MLTTKDQLHQNMAKLSENLHEDVYNFMPVTFVVDVGNGTQGSPEFDKFTTYFNLVEKHKKNYPATEPAEEKKKALEAINKQI